MKKYFIPVVVLIILASPFLIGINIKTRMDDVVVSLNEMPGYQVSMDSYKSGYLHSTGYIRIAIDPALFTSGMTPEQTTQMQSFLGMYSEGLLFKVEFSHGPYINSEQQSFGMFLANITFAETPEFINAFKEQSGIDELITTSLIMGFGGDGEINVKSPSFEVNTNEIEVSYGGFEIYAALQNWGAEYDARGAFHESLINSPSAQFTAQILPITYSASGDLSKGLMFSTGDAEIHFAGLKADGPLMVTMENLDMNVSVTTPTEETISIDYQITMDSLSSTMMEFPLENSVLNFSLSHLNTQALLNYYESISNPGVSQNPALIQQNMLTQVGDMFSNGAEYRIKQMGFEYGEDITLSLASGFSLEDGASTLLANPATMQNPLVLMGMINADLDLDFSEGFLEFAINTFLQNQSASLLAAGIQEADLPMIIEQQRDQYLMMIPQFVQSGILQTRNAGYSISAIFNKGELEVNGQPYPLPF